MPKIEQLEPTLAELQGWNDDREMSPTDDEDDSDAEYSGGGSSATLGTSPAPPSPLVKVEDDYSTVIDLTQDGEDERAEQLALAQEEGPGVQLQPVKKEEDEDVKTVLRRNPPRMSCGRDGNAPAPQTPAAPDILTDGTEAKPFAKESDIKDYAKMVTAYYNFVEPPRPAGLGTFDIPSWTPFEVANEPEVDELRADSRFKRKDLRGMEQGTIHRSHTDGRRKYGTTRLCCMEWLNIGTMQPGAPFMWFASADEWLDRDLTKNRFALFVQPTEQKCWWRYLGTYEMVGPASREMASSARCRRPTNAVSSRPTTDIFNRTSPLPTSSLAFAPSRTTRTRTSWQTWVSVRIQNRRPSWSSAGGASGNFSNAMTASYGSSSSSCDGLASTELSWRIVAPGVASASRKLSTSRLANAKRRSARLVARRNATVPAEPPFLSLVVNTPVSLRSLAVHRFVLMQTTIDNQQVLLPRDTGRHSCLHLAPARFTAALSPAQFPEHLGARNPSAPRC